jgi:hypothetical protein
MLNRLKNRLVGFLKQNSNSFPQKTGYTMTFKTLQTLALAYHEKKQEPPIMPATIETMAWAYEHICKGEDPWTSLGNFTNAWFGYAKHIRADLVSEPLIKPEQETVYTHQWAAFCAASVEFLCNRYCIPCPAWVNDPYCFLETPWWRTRQTHDPSIRKHLSQMTPTPFARRNIFCSNRLFQNKYEIYEWIQEAIDKGITNPDEIHCYTRQKEISLHGA